MGNRKTVVKGVFGGTPDTTYYNRVGGIYLPDPMNRYYKVETPPASTVNRVYDNNGNLTDDGTFLYRYDYANRLIEVRRKSDLTVVGRYGYNCMGMRIWKESAELTYFYYDSGHCIEERNSSDIIIATNVYGIYTDEILLVARGGSTYYYHTNSLGSVLLILDATGTNVEKYEYTLYGEPTCYTWTGAEWDEVPQSLVANRFCFTGREIDWETGNYFYRARHYESERGRFMSHDPDALYIRAQGIDPLVNYYRYARGNPVCLSDASGRQVTTYTELIVNPNPEGDAVASGEAELDGRGISWEVPPGSKGARGPAGSVGGAGGSSASGYSNVKVNSDQLVNGELRPACNKLNITGSIHISSCGTEYEVVVEVTLNYIGTALGGPGSVASAGITPSVAGQSSFAGSRVLPGAVADSNSLHWIYATAQVVKLTGKVADCTQTPVFIAEIYPIAMGASSSANVFWDFSWKVVSVVVPPGKSKPGQQHPPNQNILNDIVQKKRYPWSPFRPPAFGERSWPPRIYFPVVGGATCHD